MVIVTFKKEHFERHILQTTHFTWNHHGIVWQILCVSWSKYFRTDL